MKAKHIVVIETPISTKSFTQVTCLMTDEEFEEAKRERPDLVFTMAADLPVSTDSIDNTVEEPKTESLPALREDQGITITGMTLPHDLDILINKVLEDKG